MANFLLLSLGVLIAANPVAPSCTGTERVTRAAYVMGTVLRLEVTGADRACALAAAEAALSEVERLERVLSTWRPETELSRFNAAGVGVPVVMSLELASLLAEVSLLVEATDGAFDPGIGAYVDAWDLRGPGRVPGGAELVSARAGLATCFALAERIRRHAGCWLDSGGFGKGAALRAAVRVLAAQGVSEALLDFGGQVAVQGPAVVVTVAHPTDRSRPAQALRVANASLSTSAQSERFIEAGGERYGHVLDPRTGRPVAAWGSVTVLAADPLRADALSTALFVMGPEAALAWARAHADVGVLVLRIAAGEVVASWNAALEPFLVPLDSIATTSPEYF